MKRMLCVGLLVQAGFLAAGAAAESGPNFVVIMVDDMGYGDARCFGGTAFPTPGIDRIAANGVRLTDFHSNGCVCSPTRAALLTGRYQQRAGVDGVIYAAFGRNRHHGLQRAEVTFAEMLQGKGRELEGDQARADTSYMTAAIGKWHLGYEPQYNPIHQGFDRFVGYVSGNVDFHTHIDGAGVFDWWHQNQKVREPGYTTHLITEHADRFIRDAAAAGRPFCLYVAHEAPHDPYQGPQDAPVRKEGEAKLLYNHRELAHAKRAYAEMMTEMDRGILQLLDTLDELKLAEDTLVMFFSDNGATGPGSCGPLFGMKGTLWEGGHRVPFVAQWKNRIPAGSVSHQLACTMDILPTMLDVVEGVAAPDRPLDGISLLPYLVGQPAEPRTMYWKYGDALSMRDGSLKLVVNGGRAKPRANQPQINWQHPDDDRHQLALFDLSTDLAEQLNLVDARSEQVAELQTRLQKWAAEVTADATIQPDRK